MHIGVTGHRLVTPETTRLVEAAVEVELDRLQGDGDPADLVAVSCLAIGADQIVARAVLARGGSLVFVPPCRQIVTTYAPDDVEEFRRLAALASETVPTSYDEPSNDAYYDAGVAVIELSDHLLAVWDGLAAVARGGAGDAVAAAQAVGVGVTVIWPPGSARA